MDWYEFERNNVKGITGDKAIDEFAAALARIAISYEERGARKPTIAELLYALENVLGSMPERYVSDPVGLRYATLTVHRDFAYT
jgi:hypothetical protein